MVILEFKIMRLFDKFIKKITNEINISEKKTTIDKADISEEKIKKGIDFFNKGQYYEAYAIFNDLKTVFPDDKKIDEWFIKSRNAQNERSFKISGKMRPKTGQKAKKSDRNKYIAPAIADKINTSSKKEVPFNNMSRGERIEKELEEMRKDIRNSLPEDENESNEKDFPTNYSSNSFQVDENDINDQPNLNWPLPHTPPPRIPPPQLDLDLQLSNEGVKLAERGRHIEALACFDKAIAINPDSCDVWSNRGACLTRMGRFREAQIAFAKASQLLEKYGRRRF